MPGSSNSKTRHRANFMSHFEGGKHQAGYCRKAIQIFMILKHHQANQTALKGGEERKTLNLPNDSGIVILILTMFHLCSVHAFILQNQILSYYNSCSQGITFPLRKFHALPTPTHTLPTSKKAYCLSRTNSIDDLHSPSNMHLKDIYKEKPFTRGICQKKRGKLRLRLASCYLLPTWHPDDKEPNTA